MLSGQASTAQMIKEIYSKGFMAGNTNTHRIFLRHTSFLAANPTVHQCFLTFAHTLCLNLFFCIVWVEIIEGTSQICAFFGHRNQLPIYFRFTNRLRDVTAQAILVAPGFLILNSD